MRQDVLDYTLTREAKRSGATRSGFMPWYIYKLTLRCGHKTERREKHPKAFEWVDCKECDK